MYTILHEQDIDGRYTGKTINLNGIMVDEETVTYVKEGDHATHMPNSITYPDTYISYTYDGNGNITKIMQSGVLLAQYEYDTLGRLIREDNKSFNKSYFYTYDNNGNILAKESCAFTTGAHTVGTGDVTSYTYSKDKMTKFGTQSCVYDAVGNPTTCRGKSATWVRGRKLASFDGNTFEYDARGIRTRKNNIEYYYDSQGRLLKQSNGLEFFYDANGLTGLKYNGSNYVYRTDIQGNVIAILDSSGEVVVQYKYDAWGNQKVLDATGNAITDTTNIGNLNPFRYRSYYFDTETGLYYLQTRYYDPEVGRFLNIDSLDYADPETINGLNLFAYCDNNPVMNTDPNGTWAWLRALAVMAVAVLAVAAIAAVTVATGGSALPVVVGAAVGAGTNAVVSAGTQMLTTGSIDVSQLLVDTSIGMVSGAFGGSALGTVGMTIAGGVTDFAGSVAGDWVAGDNINWVGAIASAGLGALTSATFGAGAQKGKLGDRRAALSTRKSIKSRGPNGYRHITNYKFALASNKSRLTKVTKNLNREAIAEIFSGIPDSFTITVYSFLALAKL